MNDIEDTCAEECARHPVERVEFEEAAEEGFSWNSEPDPEEPEHTFTTVDVRCIYGPRELLMRLAVGEVIPVGEWNMMLLKCSWCTRQGRKQDKTIKRVIHSYNLLGEFCGSTIERF